MKKNKTGTITDLTYLKQVSKGDINFINEMIEVYLKQTPEAINELEKYFNVKDWKKFMAVTHKLKPSCPFFGLKTLYKTINSIEEYVSKQIHLEKLPGMIALVKNTCALAMRELEQEKNILTVT